MGEKVEQLGFYFDMTACVGCRTCQVACKDVHDLPDGVWYRYVRSYETGTYPSPGYFHYSGSCNHCENPKCVRGCPTGAMYVALDGTVQHWDEICIGCRHCEDACPYGIPQYIEERKIVGKCDACIDLRQKGQNPACVDACLMRCLDFGSLNELEEKYGKGLVRELPFLPSSDQTNPSLRIRPKEWALSESYRKKEV